MVMGVPSSIIKLRGEFESATRSLHLSILLKGWALTGVEEAGLWGGGWSGPIFPTLVFLSIMKTW